jgi:membrane protein YqaA with SNARE-associated domain
VSYLGLFVLILGINLLPAFGPPTWAVLVFARLNWHLNPVGLVLVGAVAAVLGRYVLAEASRRSKSHFPSKFRKNLQNASQLVERRKSRVIAILLLFLVSPFPSAQLFVAAGLLDLPIVALSSAFLLGRIVSYSIYVTVATLADKRFGDVLSNLFGSPWSIALQFVLLAIVSLVPFIDWGKWLNRSSKET